MISLLGKVEGSATGSTALKTFILNGSIWGVSVAHRKAVYILILFREKDTRSSDFKSVCLSPQGGPTFENRPRVTLWPFGANFDRVLRRDSIRLSLTTWRYRRERQQHTSPTPDRVRTFTPGPSSVQQFTDPDDLGGPPTAESGDTFGTSLISDPTTPVTPSGKGKRKAGV